MFRGNYLIICDFFIEFSVEMFGMVDLEHKETKVTIGGPKIEIQFRKKQLMRWVELQTEGTEVELVTSSLEVEEDEGEKIEQVNDDDYNDSSDLDDYGRH